MADTGWIYPNNVRTTDFNDNAGSGAPWADINNILITDNVFTTCTVEASGASNNQNSTKQLISEWDLTEDIPDGAVIDGIEVEVIRKGSNTTTNKLDDSRTGIYDYTSNSWKSKPSSTQWDTTTRTIIYGGGADKWSINNLNKTFFRNNIFFFSLIVTNSTAGTAIFSVDSVRLKVTYTLNDYEGVNLLGKDIGFPIEPVLSTEYNPSIIIKNTGLTASAGFSAKLYDGTGLVSTENINSISPGEEQTIIFDWTPADSGYRLLKIVLDEENIISETNKNDNIIFERLLVTQGDALPSQGSPAAATGKGAFTRNLLPSTKKYMDPYWYIEIETTDHSNVIMSPIEKWNTNTRDTGTWGEYGVRWGALKNTSKRSTHTLSQKINIPVSGEYRVLVQALRTPFTTRNVGYMSLKVDNETIAHEYLHAEDRVISMVDCGLHNLSEGNHVFQITSPKYCYFSFLALRKTRKYYANSRGTGNIQVTNFKFSKNSTKDINQFTMELDMQNAEYPEGFIDSKGKNGFVFDEWDTVNIYLGETRRESNRVFGGYITTPTLSADKTSLTLSGGDRLLDFTQKPIYKVLTVGGAVSSSTNDGPKFECGTIYEGMKYLCSNIEYGIDYSMIDEIISNQEPPSNGLSIDYGVKANYNSVSLNRINKGQVTKTIYGTVLRLTNQGKVGAQHAILYNNTKKPVNAAQFKTLEFDYMMKGDAIQSPFKGDVEITYYKAGQSSTINNVAHIYFTSNTGSNGIGSVDRLIEDGKFKTFSFDVKAALDIADPSSAYYVKKVAITHNMIKEDVDNASKMIIHLDNLRFHTGEAKNPKVYGSGGKYPLEILSEMLIEKGYVLGVNYGSERRYDSIVLYKEGSKYNGFDIVEGVNLSEISNIQYSPREDRRNCITKLYQLDDNGNTGMVQVLDKESIAHYRINDAFEKLDTKSKFYAEYLAKKDLDKKANPVWNYTVTLSGAPDVKVGCYVDAYLSENHLSGSRLVKSVEYQFNNLASPPLKVVVGLGRPDKKFLGDLNKLRRDVRALKMGDVTNVYRDVDSTYSDFIYPGWGIENPP